LRRNRRGYVVGGCSFLSHTADSVWSTLSGDDPGTIASRQADEKGGSVFPIPPAASEGNPLPTLNPRPAAPPIGTGNFAATSVTAGSTTGTYVGAKVQASRGDVLQLQDNVTRHNADLQQIRQSMAQDAATYYSLVGTINARRQVGTTPGNPELIAKWNQSQAVLDRMTADVAKRSSLSNQAAADSSVATYILESVKTVYGLQGAVDEDHRQLGLLEGEISSTLVPIDQLLNAISDDISRQSNYEQRALEPGHTLALGQERRALWPESGGQRHNHSTAPAAQRSRARQDYRSSAARDHPFLPPESTL
jgi:hypothetical protein